jgi:hypothetical protein
MTIIEWMGTQEALPGEDATQRWTVPEGVRLIRSAEGIALERGAVGRFHPWHRVRWIESTQPMDRSWPSKAEMLADIAPSNASASEVGGPRGATAGLSDAAIVEGAAIFGKQITTADPAAWARKIAELSVDRGSGETILPPAEDAVLDKLSERQGRRRKR